LSEKYAKASGGGTFEEGWSTTSEAASSKHASIEPWTNSHNYDQSCETDYFLAVCTYPSQNYATAQPNFRYAFKRPTEMKTSRC
jgi:hypothetical protein